MAWGNRHQALKSVLCFYSVSKQASFQKEYRCLHRWPSVCKNQNSPTSSSRTNVEADSASRPDLFPLKEGLEPASQVLGFMAPCYSCCPVLAILPAEHQLRAPPLSQPSPLQKHHCSRLCQTLWERRVLSHASLQMGIHSSLRRKPREYGLGVGLNSVNTRHPILFHHLLLYSRKQDFVGNRPLVLPKQAGP